VGAFLRLSYLTLVPLHHDEGVNGNFLVTLVREGSYHYDPQNYHGPTLYFFSAIIPWIARFLGGKEDVRPFYAAADCFILPSRYDPFPNTALEAFAMGLPAIVSSRCGAAEIIEQGMNGWVCEPDDAPGLARLMHEADGAMRRGSLPQAARRTAERYGMDEMAGKLNALYADLVRAAA